MPMSSQFSLSLELTRLIPLGLTLAEKTYEAAMSLARDLQVSLASWDITLLVSLPSLFLSNTNCVTHQSSGSDIVIEEDLAEVFGRSRIAMNMASSFRTIVAASSLPTKLCEGISLCNGPGPTVIRALTQPPYFSTVIQCKCKPARLHSYGCRVILCHRLVSGRCTRKRILSRCSSAVFSSAG
ncbi:hypothetical protein K469DRAFT_701956 [Zopfia rhizophila CBS 207.26]|uniref:Uncharacterized protein n=1 Tax=Zopfia rhizophila CBS 207.26 TaxID=1314779 RepID=A0A6A6EER7_9PEZI|nr:hypothetical protein K469DRAFT_701956 [Zopfia rhizophila CBS 207.26]